MPATVSPPICIETSGSQSTKRFSSNRAFNILDDVFPCGEYLKTELSSSMPTKRRPSSYRTYLFHFFELDAKRLLLNTETMGLGMYSDDNYKLRLYITNYWTQKMRLKQTKSRKKENFTLVSRTFRVVGQNKKKQIFTAPYFVVRGQSIKADRFGLITNLVSCGPLACKPLEYLSQTGKRFVDLSGYPLLLTSLRPSVKLGYGSVGNTMYVLCLPFLDGIVAMGFLFPVRNKAIQAFNLKKPNYQPPSWVFSLVWSYNTLVLGALTVWFLYKFANKFPNNILGIVVPALLVMTWAAWIVFDHYKQNSNWGLTLLIAASMLTALFYSQISNYMGAWPSLLVLPILLWMLLATSLYAHYMGQHAYLTNRRS